MSELIAGVDIAAPSARVWSALVDFPAYSGWNPFLTSVTGRARLGARLTVRLCPPENPPLTVKPTIVAFEPEKLLIWKGFALAPGFFDAEHRFEIQPTAVDSCRLVQSERFAGVLDSIVAPLLLDAARSGFVSMNKALKRLVESDIPPLV